MTPQSNNPAPLGIGRTLALTLYFYSKNFLPIVGFLALLLIFTIGVAALTTSVGINTTTASGLENVLLAIVFAPFAVAVHRAIVLQEPIKPARYFQIFLQRRVWRFVGYEALFLLVLGIGVVIPIIIGSLILGGADASPVVGTALILAVGAYVFGFSFVFPAVAVDEFQSLAHSRNLMQGSMWRVFWCLVIITLPIIIIQRVAKISHVGSAELIVLGVLAMMLTPLYPAVLSVAYKNATHRISID